MHVHVCMYKTCVYYLRMRVNFNYQVYAHFFLLLYFTTWTVVNCRIITDHWMLTEITLSSL